MEFSTAADRTERLELLPLGVEHAAEMAGVLGDPALHEFIGDAPLSAAELLARYRRLAAGSPDPAEHWDNWVLRWTERGCLVGTVQATVTGERAEIAWVIGTPWQGRGFAREAVRAMVDQLAGRGVRTVLAHIHPAHAASGAVAAAAGLTPTGHWHDGERRWEREL